MALVIKEDNKPKISSGRLQLEARLSTIKSIKSKKFKDYTGWAIFSYLVIRTYNDHFVIHLWGNIDHYGAVEKPYNSVNYKATGSTFIMLLLKPLNE